MKSFQKEELFVTISKEDSLKNLRTTSFSCIIESIKSGIMGFLVVIILIASTKFLSSSINPHKYFNLGINDLVLSFWGFIIISFVVFAGKNKDFK